jgi:hypothetical protein
VFVGWVSLEVGYETWCVLGIVVVTRERSDPGVLVK